MALYPAFFALRRKEILSKLDKVGAKSEEGSKKITEIGLVCPVFLSGVLKSLLEEGFIHKTEDDRYYLIKEIQK